MKPKSISRPELVQFLGAIVLVAGFFLALYAVLGQLLIFFAPKFVEKERLDTGRIGSFVIHHPFQAIMLAVCLAGFGGAVGYLSGMWARRTERVLRERLELLRAALNKYEIDTGHDPPSLRKMVEEGYLQKIPHDPIRWPSKSWTEKQSSAGGIINIRSKSRGAALDDSSYDTW